MLEDELQDLTAVLAAFVPAQRAQKECISAQLQITVRHRCIDVFTATKTRDTRPLLSDHHYIHMHNIMAYRYNKYIPALGGDEAERALHLLRPHLLSADGVSTDAGCG